MPRKFDPVFKRQAIDFVLEKSVSISRVSHDLGIGKSTLQPWVREFQRDKKQKDFSTNSSIQLNDERMRQLERENDVLRRERDILKKALAIFSLP